MSEKIIFLSLIYFSDLKISDNTKPTPPIKKQAFQTPTLAQQIEMMNMVIRNLKGRIKRNYIMLKLMVYKVGLIKVENNVRRRERCASPIIDDVFNEMGDENYNSASLGYGDQFEHSRNRRYK